MRTAAQAISRAEKLERELAVLTEKFACILQLPASRRDAANFADSWSEITQLRPQIRPLASCLRKIKKPSRVWMERGDYLAQSKMYKQARGFLKRLKAWDEMERAVQRHLNPQKHPLLPTLPAVTHDDLLAQVYKALHRLANPITQDPTAKDHGCFADIAFPIHSFNLLMSAAYRIGLAQNPKRALRFLDVGCGGGTKVFAATRFFKKADGLEYDRGYAESARRTLQLIGAFNSTVFHTDAMSFDAYSDYDVIYFYRPLRDDELLELMEQHVIRQARRGTIVVAPYNTALAPRAGMDCAKIEGPIFVTGIDQLDADQLKRDAEATGTDILKRSAEWKFDTGYWAPILDAASFNGAD